MNTRPVLRLFDQFLSEPVSVGPPLRVVPVIADDVEAAMPLVEAIVRAAEGVVVRAADCVSGVHGTRDLELARAIEAIDIPLGETVRHFVVHESPEGMIRVRFDGDDASVPVTSEGLRSIFGTVAALFADDLRASTFATLHYVETSVDARLRSLLWDLVTEHVPVHGLGRVGRLLLIVEGPFDYRRHCGQRNSALFHMTADDCRVRHPWEADSVITAAIAADSRGYSVLFLGAGFATSSGQLPLGDDLRNVALRALTDREITLEEQIRRFRSYVLSTERTLPGEELMDEATFASRLTLERVLREEFRRFDRTASPTLEYFAGQNTRALAETGDAVRALHKLVRSKRRIVIVTVNFDTLIETGVENLVEVFDDDDAFAACASYLRGYVDGSESKKPVLKLHGTVTKRQSVVANVETTHLGLQPDRRGALEFLTDAARLVRWTYVGYSMRDFDVQQVLGTATFSRGTDEIWVGPFPDPNATVFAARHRASVWPTRESPAGWNERVITQTADVFLTQLADLWTRS